MNETPDFPTLAAHRLAIADWHKTMSSYIKNDLHHKRHLLTANYTGQAPMEGYHDSPNPCESSYFDDSWQHVDIDVVSWNNYSVAANRNQTMAEGQYTKTHCLNSTYEYTGETTTNPALLFYDQQKPVVFGENGYLDYMNCDYTGYIKDLFAATFSGTASAGLSWDESKNRDHWFWMGKIKNFVESEFLNSVNLNSDDWIPNRVESNGEGKSEVVYLRKASNDNSKLIGVIINRTWNWYTVGEGLNCDVVPLNNGNENEAILPHNIDILNDVGSSGSPLKVPNMGIEKRYRIEYYDPLNLSVINSENRYSTAAQNLGLESYPLLTESRPIVFFKAWRNPIFGDEESFFQAWDQDGLLQNVNSRNPDGQNEIISMVDSSAMVSIKDEIPVELEFKVFPNPTTGVTTIVLAKRQNYNVEIFDVLGSLVYSLMGNDDFITLNVEFLASGQYVLKVNNSKVFSLIKL